MNDRQVGRLERILQLMGDREGLLDSQTACESAICGLKLRLPVIRDRVLTVMHAYMDHMEFREGNDDDD